MTTAIMFDHEIFFEAPNDSIDNYFIHNGKKYLSASEADLENITHLIVDTKNFSTRKIKMPNLESVEFTRDDVEIDNWALSDTSIKHIEFPEKVILGGHVLRSCSKLESVSFPKLSQIPYNTCRNCDKLTTVKIPDSVLYFGENCFYDCKNLNLNIPETIVEIEEGAMYGLANRELVIPASCKRIMDRAFANMKNLERLVIKNPKTWIAPSAFEGCDNLKKVQIENETYHVVHWDDVPMILTSPLKRVHGIDTATVRVIGDKADQFYVQYGKNYYIDRYSLADALHIVRAWVLDENTKKIQNDFRNLQAGDTLPKMDFTVQEIRCINTALHGWDSFLRINTSSANTVDSLDCDKCQKVHPAVYQKCMEHCGLKK